MNGVDSFHHLHQMNHWALLVSAVMIWLIGAVWYSPLLFAKPWLAALGNIHNSADKGKGMALGMIASLAGDILVSFVLLHFIRWSGSADWQHGVFIGFICWLGFFAATQLPQGIYEKRPSSLFLINAGYWLISLMASGALLASWK